MHAVGEATQELDKNLGTLIRMDMIREAARVPELEYAFRNPLTQEAVYKTILLKRRRAFHHRVGAALETLFPDRLEGLYRLAGVSLYASTGENEPGDSVFAPSRSASRRSVSFDDAIQNLRKALELIEPGTQSEVALALLEELGDVHRLVRDFAQALALFQQALTLSRSLQAADKIVAVRLHRKIVQIATDAKWSVDAEAYRRVSEIKIESRASLEASLRAAEGTAPHPETARLLIALSMDAWRNQDPPDWEGAQRFAQRAVDQAEQLDDVVVLSQALGATANVLDGQSLLSEHLQIAKRRLEVSRDSRFNDVRETIDALRGMGAALMYVGEYEPAMPYLGEAETLAARIQATDQQANALGIKAQCLFRLDRWDEVLATEEKWRDLERRYTRERVGETCFYVALSASIHALRGDSARANAYAKESSTYMIGMSGEPAHWQRNQHY